MSTDKTLADVQPGGRVRLGDGPTIEKQARDLLAKEWEMLSFDAPVEELRQGCELPPVVAASVRAIVAALSAHSFPDGQRDNSDLLAALRDVEEHLYCAGSNPSHTETVRAAINALSAQPSPGGQGDALVTDEMVQAACKVWAETPGQGEDWMRTALQAALAARQPVDPEHGQIDPSWSLHDRVEFALRDAGFDLDEAAFVAEAADRARQPVGVTVAYGVSNRDGLWMCDFGLATINKESAESFAVWAEEHRTISGPFTVVSLYAAPPAQVVDLGQFHALAAFGEEFAFSAEKQPQSRVIYAQARRLLALIDRKADGNG